MLLFAYASNMDVDEFAKTVPSAKKIANVKVAGYQFGFTLNGKDGSSKASLVPSVEPTVTWGVLIEFNDNEKDNFFFQEDWFEWAAVNCTDETGNLYKAWAFITQPHAVNDFTLPYDWYHAKILNLAKKQGFPADYILSIEQMPCKVDPDEKRRAKKMREL
jgi:hypothetical protein